MVHNLFNLNRENINTVGFWKRALSFIIDIAIINLIIIYPFKKLFNKYLSNITISQSFSASVPALPSSVYWAIFIISILALFYLSFFDYYLGQTPGQMILKIKSISLRIKDGKQDISIWSAFLRNCFILPFFPFYIFWLIDPLYLAFYKERFLEKITFTRTVNESEKIKGAYRNEEYKLNKV